MIKVQKLFSEQILLSARPHPVVLFPTMYGLSFVEQGISLGIRRSRTVFCCALVFDVCFPAALKKLRNPFEFFFFIWSGNYKKIFFQHLVCAPILHGPTRDGRLF